jgi:hypothetical protein
MPKITTGMEREGNSSLAANRNKDWFSGVGDKAWSKLDES